MDLLRVVDPAGALVEFGEEITMGGPGQAVPGEPEVPGMTVAGVPEVAGIPGMMVSGTPGTPLEITMSGVPGEPGVPGMTVSDVPGVPGVGTQCVADLYGVSCGGVALRAAIATLLEFKKSGVRKAISNWAPVSSRRSF